ncbi:MAG TPA: ADP-ribosylglycohydrolase family protein [Bacilli bacterium]
MLGTIIGDIVGSRFEFHNHKRLDFEFFTEQSFVTDDSLMSLAVAKAIMETEKKRPYISEGKPLDSEYYSLLEKMAVKYMQKIGRRYPGSGFGGMFYNWLFSENPRPYNSFGNGAAMRISPAGFIGRSEAEVRSLAHVITGVTHNHPEGLKGAEATAVAIYLARKGRTLSEIRERINRDYYPIDFLIDDIRPTYSFDVTCQGTVPQALSCFFESTSFENAIRLAISLGGDSDTLAAITGGVAEAYYGVPEEIKTQALSYLDDYLLAIYQEWEDFLHKF